MKLLYKNKRLSKKKENRSIYLKHEFLGRHGSKYQQIPILFHFSLLFSSILK